MLKSTKFKTDGGEYINYFKHQFFGKTDKINRLLMELIKKEENRYKNLILEMTKGIILKLLQVLKI